MYKGLFYLIVTTPMVFFVWYMWNTFPDQVLLHSIGTAAFVIVNAFFAYVLAVSE